MAMENHPKYSKTCVTCAYFVANRFIDGGGIKCDGSTYGKCFRLSAQGSERKANSTCNRWEKWAAIR